MIAYDAGRPLISLHVPKCAGQSLRRVLERWYGDRLFIHYFQQHGALPPRHEFRPGICIHGHFNRSRGFGVMEYYPDAGQFITVLRDPLQAAISNYFFWKAKARANQLRNGSIRAGDERDYRDIDDFFAKRPKAAMLDFLPGEWTAANYQEILETKFVWIGLVESLPASVAELAGRLGFTPPPLARINASPRDEELSAALRQRFIQDNPLEFAIYQYAKKAALATGVQDAR